MAAEVKFVLRRGFDEFKNDFARDFCRIGRHSVAMQTPARGLASIGKK
jgi:hypothetical protein